MAGQPTQPTRDEKKAMPAGTQVAGGRKAEGGQEVWHVTIDGKKKTLVTSTTSASAMDEAKVIYSGALKRLANR